MTICVVPRIEKWQGGASGKRALLHEVLHFEGTSGKLVTNMMTDRLTDTGSNYEANDLVVVV